MAEKSRFTLAVLALPGFRLLLLTRMFTAMASHALAVIVGWQIYELTKDPLMLGLTGLIEAVPAITCAFFAGHFVDTHQPRHVFFGCLAVMAINGIVLTSLAGGYVPIGQSHLITLIFIGIFIIGIARSFIIPASFSMLAQVVPRRQLPAASSWMSSSFQAAAIVAPAVAGLVYGGYGVSIAWLLPTGLIVTAFLMLNLMPPLTRLERERRLPVLQSIKEGWSFILKTPVLIASMSLDMLAVLFGGAVALLPAFASEVLFTGPQGLGMLRAMPAIGAIGVALYLAVRPMEEVHGAWMMRVVAGFGVCMIGFGLSTTLPFALFFLTLSGVFDSVSVVIRSTLVQLLTPDAMRGRVSSVNSMFIISSNEIGAFESGLLARLIGIVPAIVTGGIGTLLVCGGVATKWPELSKQVVKADNNE